MWTRQIPGAQLRETCYHNARNVRIETGRVQVHRTRVGKNQRASDHSVSVLPARTMGKFLNPNYGALAPGDNVWRHDGFWPESRPSPLSSVLPPRRPPYYALPRDLVSFATVDSGSVKLSSVLPPCRPPHYASQLSCPMDLVLEVCLPLPAAPRLSNDAIGKSIILSFRFS